MKTPTAAQLDQQRVKEMKRLLATAGGEKAVQQRYGEGSTSSPEFKAAIKQREAIRRRQQDTQRDEARHAEAAKKGQPKPNEAKATTQPKASDGPDVTAQKVAQDRARRVQKRAEQREKEAREGLSR